MVTEIIFKQEEKPYFYSVWDFKFVLNELIPVLVKLDNRQLVLANVWMEA